jgi:hypothetical protein
LEQEVVDIPLFCMALDGVIGRVDWTCFGQKTWQGHTASSGGIECIFIFEP